jgi:hypothetical protein
VVGCCCTGAVSCASAVTCATREATFQAGTSINLGDCPSVFTSSRRNAIMPEILSCRALLRPLG